MDRRDQFVNHRVAYIVFGALPSTVLSIIAVLLLPLAWTVFSPTFLSGLLWLAMVLGAIAGTTALWQAARGAVDRRAIVMLIIGSIAELGGLILTAYSLASKVTLNPPGGRRKDNVSHWRNPLVLQGIAS